MEKLSIFIKFKTTVTPHNVSILFSFLTSLVIIMMFEQSRNLEEMFPLSEVTVVWYFSM